MIDHPGGARGPTLRLPVPAGRPGHAHTRASARLLPQQRDQSPGLLFCG